MFLPEAKMYIVSCPNADEGLLHVHFCCFLQDEYDSYMSYLLDTQKPSQHKVLYHHIDSLSENPTTSDKLKVEEKRVEILEREARHLLDENARYDDLSTMQTFPLRNCQSPCP